MKKIHPDAKYVGNGWVAFKKTKKPKGFAMPYSTRSLDEDIATTAELLFENPNDIKSTIANDDILQSKVRYLQKWYEAKSGGEIGEEYWKAKIYQPQ